MAVVTRCPGKLNLFLELVARRPDGYHDLDSLVVEAPVHDVLTVERARDPGVRLTVVPEHPSAEALPLDDGNLVVRAAAAALRALDVRGRGVTLRLEKRIPVGAGLGGGSSDAAGTLRAICDLIGGGGDDDGLAAVAADLGSDVPYFLRVGAARMRGRGERLTPAHRGPGIGFAVLFPGEGASTAAVYARCRVPGAAEARDIAPARAALAAGDAAALASACFNRLGEPAEAVAPRIAAARAALESLGLGPAHVTGSGSACFVVLGARMPAPAELDALLAPFPAGARWWVDAPRAAGR